MASAVHEHLREYWRDLKRGRPGRRFQERYDRARGEDPKYGAGHRLVLAALAGICLVIGAVLAVIPGPALPFFFLAGGLLATESRPIARFMDWSEVRVRRLIARAKTRWHRLPTVGRIIVAIFAVCCSAAGAYVSFRLIRGGM